MICWENTLTIWVRSILVSSPGTESPFKHYLRQSRTKGGVGPSAEAKKTQLIGQREGEIRWRFGDIRVCCSPGPGSVTTHVPGANESGSLPGAARTAAFLHEDVSSRTIRGQGWWLGRLYVQRRPGWPGIDITNNILIWRPPSLPPHPPCRLQATGQHELTTHTDSSNALACPRVLIWGLLVDIWCSWSGEADVWGCRRAGGSLSGHSIFVAGRTRVLLLPYHCRRWRGLLSGRRGRRGGHEYWARQRGRGTQAYT